MEPKFKEELKEVRKRIKEKEQYTIILMHIFNKIQTPNGLQEPQVRLWIETNVNCVISTYDWPLEASCGIAAELETLLETECKYSFDDNSVHYSFFEDTAFEFKIIGMYPKNCKIISEGKYEFPTPIRVECGEEPQGKV